MKIAIVGTGISGLVAAYLLESQYDVTVFEAGDYVGGHTHTIPVETGAGTIPVDTGFIVFNDWTYPNFIRLLEKLGVASQASSMGFSVSCARTGLEYSGNSLSGLFAQRANLCRPAHLGMIRDILRFFRAGKRFLANPDESLSLGDYLERGGYGHTFSEYFLVPMMSAIWSAAPSRVRDFPAAHFLRFFKNHGLLNLLHRPTWRVVQGGSSRYVEKIISRFQERIRLNAPVARVTREAFGVRLALRDGSAERFDHVILAVHSDQALRMLADPSDAEREVLGSIVYQENEVVLHTDTRLLPRSRRAWSSWNYRILPEDPGQAVLTYNMNMLQGLHGPQTYCVTLNQSEAIDPEKVLGRYAYAHPVYGAQVLAAQARWGEISGQRHTHFCGAYWGYGFHEDGVNSALAVCQHFGRRLG